MNKYIKNKKFIPSYIDLKYDIITPPKSKIIYDCVT